MHADVLVYNRQLTDTERKSLEAAISSKYGLLLPTMTVPGLQAWLRADDLQSYAAASCITSWGSVASAGVSAALSSTCPTASSDTLNGYKYAVFDTSDKLQLAFNYTQQAGFSVVYLARVPSGGNRKRLLAGVNSNWLMGFHNGYAPKLYADAGGWLTSSSTTTTTYNWVIFTLTWARTGTISFYQDGALVGSYANSAGNYGAPDAFAFNMNPYGEFSDFHLAGATSSFPLVSWQSSYFMEMAFVT